MKAVRLHEFGDETRMQWEEVPLPTAGPYEVLVKLGATSVNALDVKLRSGALRGFMDFPLPLILGCDIAGTVEDAGSLVSEFRIGDRVFGMPTTETGTYAEYVVMQEEELALLPSSMSFEDGASLPTAALTAWQGLLDVGQLKAGQRTLIHGAAGGVGSMPVQIAKLTGCEVTATAKTTQLDFVKALGADKIIDYTRQAFDALADGFDLVFDVLGGETRARSWKTLRRDGILVSTVPPFPTSEEGRPFAAHGKGFGVHPDQDQLNQIVSLVASGRLKPTVDRVFPLSDAASAHKAFAEGSIRGKIVLSVGENIS